MKRPSGTFHHYRNSMECVAVSRAHKLADLDAHKVADAITSVTSQVNEVSGCNCVTFADLLKIKSGGAK